MKGQISQSHDQQPAVRDNFFPEDLQPKAKSLRVMQRDLERVSQQVTDNFVGNKASRRILEISQQQLLEENSPPVKYQDANEEIGSLDKWREGRATWDEESNNSNDDEKIHTNSHNDDLEPHDLKAFNQLIPQMSANLGDLIVTRIAASKMPHVQTQLPSNDIPFKATEAFKKYVASYSINNYWQSSSNNLQACVLPCPVSVRSTT